MKRLVSAVMAVFLAFSVMSVSVFANDEVDLQAIQDAWFEYTLTNSQHAGHLGSDEWEDAIENNPRSAVMYELFSQFLIADDNSLERSLDKIDITNWRDLEQLSDDFDDWLSKHNNKELIPFCFEDIEYDEDENQWIIYDDELDKSYSIFKNENAWSFIDEENSSTVLTVGTLSSKFSYIYENIETDGTSSANKSKSDSSKTSEQTRAAANAYEGQRASGTTKASAETASEQQRATTSTTAPAEQDDSNIGIYVVLIVLIITTGVVIIVVNNNKNKNK